MKVEDDPFPHLVTTDLFDKFLCEQIRAEFPDPYDAGWKRYGNDKEYKLEGPSTMWGPRTREYFTRLWALGPHLSEWFDIPSLTLETVGGGFHLIPPGGYLGVHADFNVSPTTGFYRRLNVLTYLNAEDPGGHLELWGDDGPVVDIAPMMGTTAIFATSDTSWHGHPKPTDGWRASIAAYFFSPAKPPGFTREHSTVWWEDRRAS